MKRSVLWAALPHSLRSDPRSISISDRAFRDLVEAVLWSSENRTDGALTKGYIGRFMSEASAAELREAGILDEHGVITFFLDCNRSKLERDAASEHALKGAAALHRKVGHCSEHAPSTPPSNAEYRVERRDKREQESDHIAESASPPSPPAPDLVEADLVSAPVRKPRKPPSGDHAEMITLWVELFERATGSKPTIQGGKDGAAVARILKHGRDEVERRMRRCFETRQPEWAWRDGPPTLANFCSSSVFDKLLDVVPSPMAVHRAHSNGRPSPLSFLTD